MITNDVQEIISSRKGKRIVFTNGCFDVIHKGHVTYLNQAKSLGDILVVGLNSDESVKRLKGPERPINAEQDRKFILQNLRAVDYVVIFNEDTPYNLIKMLMPDFLVKGGDWSVDKIIGSDLVIQNGGKVLSLPFVMGHSTTSILERIKSL